MTWYDEAAAKGWERNEKLPIETTIQTDIPSIDASLDDLKKTMRKDGMNHPPLVSFPCPFCHTINTIEAPINPNTIYHCPKCKIMYKIFPT